MLKYFKMPGQYSIQYSPNQCFTFTINALKSHVMRQFNEFLKILFPGSATTKPAVKLNFNIDLIFNKDTIRT